MSNKNYSSSRSFSQQRREFSARNFVEGAPPSPSLNAITLAYKANILLYGGSISDVDLQIVNDTLIQPLDDLGLLSASKIIDLWPCAGESDANISAVRVKAYYQSVPILTNGGFDAGAYDKASGLKGNGSSLGLGFAPSEVFTDNASLGVIITEANSSGAGAEVVSDNITNRFLLHSNLGGTSYFDCFNDGSGRASGSNSGGTGVFIASRSSPSSAKIFKNGTSFASTTTSGGSVPNAQILYFGFSSNARLAGGFIGKGLSDSEVVAVNAILTNYKNTLRP